MSRRISLFQQEHSKLIEKNSNLIQQNFSLNYLNQQLNSQLKLQGNPLSDNRQPKKTLSNSRVRQVIRQQQPNNNIFHNDQRSLNIMKGQHHMSNTISNRRSNSIQRKIFCFSSKNSNCFRITKNDKCSNCDHLFSSHLHQRNFNCLQNCKCSKFTFIPPSLAKDQVCMIKCKKHKDLKMSDWPCKDCTFQEEWNCKKCQKSYTNHGIQIMQ